MAKLVLTPPLDNPTFAIDQTGVGRAVVDIFRKANLSAWLRPIFITGGHTVTLDGGIWHVPKKELVSVLQALLQTGRLKSGPVPERELLVQKLLNFRVTITAAANETFEALRERDHDDLVLSVALAAWLGMLASAACLNSVFRIPRNGYQIHFLRSSHTLTSCVRTT